MMDHPNTDPTFYVVTFDEAPDVRMVVAPIGLVNLGVITGAKIGTIRTRI
jgi:hypothetical protein